MDWIVEDFCRGQIALTVIALLLAVGGVWFGRRKLALAVPLGLVFLLLAAIAIPSAIPARPTAQRNACVYNLRAIQEAKAEWAKKNGKLPGDIPADGDFYGTNGTGGILRHRLACPGGGTYTTGAVSQNPTCTFSNRGHRLE